MRAMMLLEPEAVENEPLAAVEIPDPKPAAGQIRLRVSACGICHTDLHTVEGEINLPRLPIIPGHQTVGVVDEVGEGVTCFKLGDRVGMPWLAKTCGNCDFCKTGRENLCRAAEFNGLHRDGGYAEYAISDAEFAYPISPAFGDVEAAPLLCAGIIGYRALKLARVPQRGRLGLFGFGASAHVTIQIARHLGYEVFVFTRSAEHREHAKNLGAVWTGAPDADPGVKLDSAINFTPSGEIAAAALKLLERGGTVACAGIHQSPLPEIPYENLYHERVLTSVANFTRRDAEELLALAVKIPIKTEARTFDLSDANVALLALKKSEIPAAAVIVIPAPA